jgi:hypothetical protein
MQPNWVSAFNQFKWEKRTSWEYYSMRSQRFTQCNNRNCLGSSKNRPSIIDMLSQLLQTNGTKSGYRMNSKEMAMI